MLANLIKDIHYSAFAEAIRVSGTYFPTLESLHVIAITLVFGSILIVDLRLIGVGGHRASARKLIQELTPYTWGAFAMAAVTGSMLFTSNAIGYAANSDFLTKMVLIAIAGLNMAVFHWGSYREIAVWDTALPPPVGARVAGALSIMLWLSVIFFGRWIGFSVVPGF